MLQRDTNIKIFSDGGFSIPRGVGGWGIVVVEEDEVIHTESGTEKNSTSNRMEMTAFLTALKFTEKPVTIYTDSNYVVQGYNLWMNNWVKNGWKNAKNDSVKNCDLWLQIYDLKDKIGDRVTVKWTKGHNLKAGTKEAYYNDMVDGLTRQY